VIDFSQYSRMQHLHREDKLSAAQIAAKMSLNVKTVSKWLARERFEPRKNKGRSSKLDPHKANIRGWLEKHRYSAQQIFQRLCDEHGYTGGYTTVKTYVRRVRPPQEKAYLSLSFSPGESAQVDWGHCGNIAVGNTRRALSVFVMVLSYSRQMYVEFTLSQKQEHFLGCHARAFEYFGGVPGSVMVDNLKSAVLAHRRGEQPVWNPRYAGFARDYGFGIVACNPRSPQEKGRVENGVGYVKKNFLRGRQFKDFHHIAPQARSWLDLTANQRVHRGTGEKPAVLWKREKAHLQPLPVNAPQTATLLRRRATSTFRVCIDGNRYSVPAQYANHYLDIYLDSGGILVRHQGDIVASHRRDYGRGGDFEHPDHPRALLAGRRKARAHKQLQSFLQLGEHAEAFYHQLQQRRLNAPEHVRKILALEGTHTRAQLAEAISDAHQIHAHSSEYIINILGQRSRPVQEPGPLHLTRPGDQLEIETPRADLSVYDAPGHDQQPSNTQTGNTDENHDR
jgi:transposase